ncbi:MAG: MBOAT family protein [Methylobacteriaceae bacterium]|nr:MBOAT family protein [Methylobacteriaceae bacterium]
MIFTEGKFFVFFAVAFGVYWTIRSNLWRKLWLLACSIAFYAAWDWRFLGLVLLVIVNTYAVTLLTVRMPSPSGRRAVLAAGIVVSLSVLGLFKYYNFFVASLSQIIALDARIEGLILPIGISFYTFHSLSYMIDVYRSRIVPTRSFIDVSLYILFFPQLVAGPIVRATDLLPQLRNLRAFTAVDFKLLLAIFLIGYFKKALVSDNLSPLVEAFYAAPENFGAVDGLIATLFYTVQIYCDFSGYTDMAIAVAGMLGYQLRPNFDHPYLAASLIDFWRRWHMSLSSWLRDYLYIPLGGSRHGPLVQARNILITMLLGGLWHGASWTFVLWGGLHGAGLIINRAWRAFRRPGDEHGYWLAGNALTFAFVWFAWILFRSPSLETAIAVLRRFTVWSPPALLPWQAAAGALMALAVVHAASRRINLKVLLSATNDAAFAFGYGAAVALILPFVNVAVQPFIYFQF